MKKIFKKNKEDVKALYEILFNKPEGVTIEISKSGICTNPVTGEQSCGHEVKIGEETTIFTEKLFKFLVEKNMISKVDDETNQDNEIIAHE